MNPGAIYTFTITGKIGTVCTPTAVSNTAYIIGASGSRTVRKFTNIFTRPGVGTLVLPKSPCLENPSSALSPGGALLSERSKNPIKCGVDILKFEVWPTQAGTVTMRIYTLKSRLVRTITQIVSGGTPIPMEWDGKDSDNQPVPSGTYSILIGGCGLKTKVIKVGVIGSAR